MICMVLFIVMKVVVYPPSSYNLLVPSLETYVQIVAMSKSLEGALQVHVTGGASQTTLAIVITELEKGHGEAKVLVALLDLRL